MTDRMQHSRELDALERLLDSHGADRTRWPAPARLRFASLITESPEARRAMRGAEALDRLLDRAPATTDARRAALADRILSAALDEASQPAAGQATVVPLAGRRKRMDQVASRVASSGWSAAALLAASLLVGVFAGVSGKIPPAVQSVALLTGVDTDGDLSADWSAWDDISAGAEEDTL